MDDVVVEVVAEDEEAALGTGLRLGFWTQMVSTTTANQAQAWR